ncbi:MAG TPA: hypothetical protein VGN01_14560 [Acidobacteriaceae bacterium]
MAENYPGARTRSTWTILLALVCILLVAVMGTVQVVHTHADGTDTHSTCPLCAAAHITVHLVQTPAPAPPASVATFLEALPLSAIANAFSTFALFTRPPPLAPVAA